ncbi:hypothetical protein TeGR_g5630 [Tetraparma gracilis]|uniref:Equilibrative nucleoside transporter n=1 Tax=Tetraparma gracilis TaxID=2962635 RepID=A0ABQ6MTT7_9STRA|nr:hypothetical protein TeGR_g5630 [Tetraparma gracilis]
MNLGLRLLATNVLILFLLPLTPFVFAPLLHANYISSSVTLWLVYFTLCLLSLCVAINQSTCYGVAGTFGPEFMCYLETGKGWAGLGIIGLRMLLKYTFAHSAYAAKDPEAALILSTKFFFLFGTLVVFLAVAASVVLFRMPWAAQRLEEYYSMPTTVSDQTPVVSRTNSPNVSPRSTVYSPALSRPRNRSFPPKVKMTVAKRIAAPAVGVFLSFVVCIACFPGIATSMHSNDGFDSWYPVLVVACYNTADLVGKALPAVFMPFRGKRVLFLVVLQALVLPLMILEKVYDAKQHTVARSSVPGIGFFGNDYTKLATVTLLGILTGYAATCCLMVAPAMVKSKFKETAAQMMSLCLIAGLFVGSVVGVVISESLGLSNQGAGASVPFLHFDSHDSDGPHHPLLNEIHHF